MMRVLVFAALMPLAYVADRYHAGDDDGEETVVVASLLPALPHLALGPGMGGRALVAQPFLRLSGSNGPMTGNLDMGNNLILNIGAAGTDFTSGGGLNIAGTITSSAAATAFDANGADIIVTAAATEWIEGGTASEIPFVVGSATRAAVHASGARVVNDHYWTIGTTTNNSTDAWGWNTAQTPDTGTYRVGTTSRLLLLIENGDQGTDFAKAQQTNPTLCLQSSDQTTTTDRICLAHDQTDGNVTTDGGDLNLTPAGGDVVIASRVASPPASLISVDAATAIAVTRNVHTVDCVGAETITTATGGRLGMLLTLIFETDADVCTLTDTAAATADTFNLSAAFASTTNDTISFVHDGTKWLEIGRGVN